MGGPETDLVGRLLGRLTTILRVGCPGPYSRSIANYSLFFVVEGSLERIEKYGLQGVRLSKGGAIACTIHVPESSWKHKPADQVRCILALSTSEPFNAFVARVRKAGIEWQEDVFLADTNAAIEAFLAEDGEPELTEGDREFRQKLRLLVEHRQYEVAMGKPRSPIGRGILELLQSDPEGLPPGVH